MKTTLYIIALILNLLFFSCDRGCDEETCLCKTINLVFYYNFSDSSNNSFPLEQMDNFQVIVFNNKLMDTVYSYKLVNPLYAQDAFKKLEIVIEGELNSSSNKYYNDLTYYILNKELGYIDSIYSFEFNYSIIRCNKQKNGNYCGDPKCMDIDESSAKFYFNNKQYKFSDLPITINYDK